MGSQGLVALAIAGVHSRHTLAEPLPLVGSGTGRSVCRPRLTGRRIGRIAAWDRVISAALHCRGQRRPRPLMAHERTMLTRLRRHRPTSHAGVSYGGNAFSDLGVAHGCGVRAATPIVRAAIARSPGPSLRDCDTQSTNAAHQRRATQSPSRYDDQQQLAVGSHRRPHPGVASAPGA